MGKRSIFFRLNYSTDDQLRNWIQAGWLPTEAASIAPNVRMGCYVLAARFNPTWDKGEVRAVGKVIALGQCTKVIWRTTHFDIEPSGYGRQQWSRYSFNFEPGVAARYRLQERCEALFPEVVPVPAEEDGSPNHLPMRSGLRHNQRCSVGRPGYVYVLASQLGHKIGRSSHLLSRTRHFTVKLPFPTQLLLSGWFEDSSAAEAHFHRVYASKRLQGEWFDLGERELSELRLALAQKPNLQ